MITPPKLTARPHELTHHGDTRIDPYYWVMDKENPEVIDHLTAENEFLTSALSHLEPTTELIYEEIKGRIEETDTSVPTRRGGWWIFERTTEGQNYPIVCRVPVGDDLTTPPHIVPGVALANEQIIIDENLEAGDSDFFSVGVLALSDDDRWVAVGTDFEGGEQHRVTFRPLDGQEGVDDVLDNVHYGFAWASDSRHVFYTRADDAWRSWQVWRHELGTSAEQDVLVLQEDDAQYNVDVSRSRDREIIFITSSSKITTECSFIPSNNPTATPTIFEERRHGIEYGIDQYRHDDGSLWWLKVTNEEATNFRLVVRRDDEQNWRPVIAERSESRLDDVEIFAGFLAVAERHDGAAAVRIVPLGQGDDPFAGDLFAHSYLVPTEVAPSTVTMGANLNVDTTHLRIHVASLITPSTVADLNLTTGELIVRKQQKVKGGFTADDYVTGRLWVSASDGQRIPVSVVGHRTALRRDADGTLHAVAPSPFLLYGYGSYEISIDPYFSPARLSLLDRGVIFGIAHIRGGGELGRHWYEMGKMAQKPTTFSDFVRVGRFLVDQGWTTPEQLAARGGSAGGLLMGAVINLDPTLFRCVIAEVPFVDSLTTILDETLPLTVAEWDEWGNPLADATAYRTMKHYSPYDNVRAVNADGSPRRYPDIWATAGLNDTRVGFWEPTKWAAKIRDVNPDNVVFLKTEMGAGHGGSSGRYDSWRDEAQVLSFLLDRITSSAS